MPSELEGQTIATRLAAIAQRLPEKVAIIERDTQITFRQLDQDATAIARRILALDRGRGGVVCLLFEDKLPAIKAIFGAGRSGHAYVPLDAGDPEQRLRFILQDSGPVAMLTQGSLRERATSLAPPGCPVIDVDLGQGEEEATPFPVVNPDQPVFVYYTSGSTGQPKGVAQTHGNFLYFVDAYAKTLRIGPEDRTSLLFTMSVAAANNNVFRGLLHGATLCAFDMRREGIPQLADWLDRERITILHAVPTVFREMAGRLAPERLLPHLRAIHLGGEAVFTHDVELYRRRTLAHCVLVNQLASTEAGVIAQNLLDHRSPLPTSAVVPVGRCLDRVRVEIRRDDGSMAEVDEVGEMFVCGPHVSPGYWRRPELDAAVFSMDPNQPGWRRYRSGDLGHVDAAGNLHFHGRRGSRVKIRGHSVDLTEVDAALAGCPGVAKAATVAVGDDARSEPARLVAYVEMCPEATRDPLALRRHLASCVPRYMLPARVVYVDTLPLTAGGKIDRSALSHVDAAAGVVPRAIELPRDDVERAVARMFERLVLQEPVGRDDDFFLLGGDSLLGVELQGLMKEAFGVLVGNFHEDSTVARIAANVHRALAERTTGPKPLPVLIPLWRDGSEPPLFLVHGRHGQAFVSPHFMQLLGNQQPVWALQARGLDGLREPHSTVEDMAAEYLAEVRKERPRGPYFLGSLCAGAYVAAAMARKLREAGESVLPLLLLDPPNPAMHGGYSQMTDEQFARKMKARKASGRTGGPVEDPAYMKALRATALAFEQAIGNHRPLPYDGAVYVLSSRRRMQDPVGLRRVFTGRFKRYEVGATHSQALDPRNPVFVSSLLRCVGLIREAAREFKPVGVGTGCQ